MVSGFRNLTAGREAEPAYTPRLGAHRSSMAAPRRGAGRLPGRRPHRADPGLRPGSSVSSHAPPEGRATLDAVLLSAPSRTHTAFPGDVARGRGRGWSAPTVAGGSAAARPP